MSTPININKMHFSQISDLARKECERLGSQSRLAVKCDVSDATISQIITGKFDQVRDGMWRKVAAVLDWRPDGWQIVETSNTRSVHQIMSDAKEQRLWLTVCDGAGAGKTSGAKTFVATNRENVYYLECDEWNKGEFVRRFARSLGISFLGCGTYYDLLDKIVRDFQQKSDERPLIILDQADKLRDAAFRCLIPLFNGLEDKAGMVVMGVGHIRKRIRRNVELQTCGFDEIESRFGRKYINLPGHTRTDVANICRGNGLEDPETIKRIWAEVWGEEKGRSSIEGREVNVIKDNRRLKRCIQREILMLSEASPPPPPREGEAYAEALESVAA